MGADAHAPQQYTHTHKHTQEDVLKKNHRGDQHQLREKAFYLSEGCKLLSLCTTGQQEGHKRTLM